MPSCPLFPLLLKEKVLPDLIVDLCAKVPCNSSSKHQTPICVPKSPSGLGDFWVGHTHLIFGQESAFPSPFLLLDITGPLWFRLYFQHPNQQEQHPNVTSQPLDAKPQPCDKQPAGATCRRHLQPSWCSKTPEFPAFQSCAPVLMAANQVHFQQSLCVFCQKLLKTRKFL